jgi:hypothetical protein
MTQRHITRENTYSFLRVTQEDIHGDPNSSVNGLDAWADRGIAGRGVFIDYFDWATENGIEYNPLSTYAVPLDHITKIISEKQIAIRTGDIFILRTGGEITLIG